MSSMSFVDDGHSIQIRVPMQMKRRGGRKEIVVPDSLEQALVPVPDYHEALVIAISRAHCWKELLDGGRYRSVAEMAREHAMNRYHMARLLRLTLLAPDIVEAILEGREPDGLSLERLRRPVPALWSRQRDLLVGV